jgi:hypothetical protein
MTDIEYDLYLLFIDLIIKKETMPKEEWVSRIKDLANRINATRQVTLFELEESK